MSLPQEQFDELLHRTALASLFYYPEIAADDSDYHLRADVEYCLEPVASLGRDDLERLRTVVGRVIANPSGNRSELLALVIELAPEPVGD
jgi:hypothetical protein